MSFPLACDDAEVGFPKVAAALDLIAAHSPRALGHVQRHLRRIVILGEDPCVLARYLPGFRWCVLHANWVLEEAVTPAMVAMTIVHEATHGRLHARGITSYTEQNRVRVERRCMKAELALAAHLPDGEALREAVEQEYAAVESRWSLEQMQERHSASLQHLCELKVPRWFIAAVDWLNAPPAVAEDRGPQQAAAAAETSIAGPGS